MDLQKAVPLVLDGDPFQMCCHWKYICPSLIFCIYLFKCLFNEVVKPLHDVPPDTHTNTHLANSLQQDELNPIMIKQPSFKPHAFQSCWSINMIYFSGSGRSRSKVNTNLVSYCRIDLPSSHPGDDLWQNKQPFGPSSLSAVTLSEEICGLNQRSDDTQPSVVVLSVLGHEVGRKHTIVVFISVFKQIQIHRRTQRVCRRHSTQKHMYTIADAHTNAKAHTSSHHSPESPILK